MGKYFKEIDVPGFGKCYKELESKQIHIKADNDREFISIIDGKIFETYKYKEYLSGTLVKEA